MGFQHEQGNGKYRVYQTIRGGGGSHSKNERLNQDQRNLLVRGIEQSPGDSNAMTVNARERYNIVGMSSMSKNGVAPLQGYLSSLKNSQGKSRTPQET